jgi:hypothetical protein
MMSHAPVVRPPRVATWLVDLFASDEHAESLPGDLLEEFSDLASKSGVASARRWYWRQSVKTIVHLFATGFRAAPWSIVGAVIGGYLLLGFGLWIPERLVSTLTLALVRGPLAGVGVLVSLVRQWPHPLFMLPFLIFSFAGSMAIVIGGLIVRMRRSAPLRRALGA